MENKEKEQVFEQFIEKAAKRLEERKVRKTAELMVPSLGQTIRVRGLTDAELSDVISTDDPQDVYAADYYSVYLGCVEPDLRKAAQSLKEQGKIRTYQEIAKIFECHEAKDISAVIMELSGVTGENKVEKVIDGLKN